MPNSTQGSNRDALTVQGWGQIKRYFQMYAFKYHIFNGTALFKQQQKLFPQLYLSIKVVSSNDQNRTFSQQWEGLAPLAGFAI